MGNGTYRSASIFFLPFGVDTEWFLQDTSVQSPIFRDVRFFARGVFDLAEAGLDLPLDVEITVERVTPITKRYVAAPTKVSLSWLTADTTAETTDEGHKTVET